MIVSPKEFYLHNLRYTVRSAKEKDAKNLSEVRLQIDGETENFDREKGEAFIDESGFKQIIKDDTESSSNLFLVAEVDDRIVGFIRGAGNKLKRTSHKVKFGIGVLKEYWGYGIKLYQNHGFQVEGVLKKDKLLSDGNYYNTIVMGRFHE